MKIAFLSNKITLRGTEVALYDYAHFNEVLLGNTSIVITRDIRKYPNEREIAQEGYDKFSKRFPMFYYTNVSDIEQIVEEQKVDALYIIKAGGWDNLLVRNCKNLIHGVFTAKEPHGDVFAVISDFINEDSKTNAPVIPHMIHIHDTTANLRKELGIPDDSLVFGTYSGAEEFNIPYIRKVVEDLSQQDNNIYFIFMNVNPFMMPNAKVMFLAGTSDMEFKRRFINTCDAMLYGRDGGETFGLSVGEFCTSGKPIVCRANEKGNYHLQVLGDAAIKHSSYGELFHILTHWEDYKHIKNPHAYDRFSPANVMAQFQRVFLS